MINLKSLGIRKVSTSRIRITRKGKMYSFFHRRQKSTLMKRSSLLSIRLDNGGLSYNIRQLRRQNPLLSMKHFKNFY